MVREMIKGLSIVVLFSVSFATIAYATGSDPIKWFLVSFLAQFILTALVNTVTRTWAQIQINKLKVQRLNEIDKNVTGVRCAGCGHLNEVYVDIKTPDDNSFHCVSCNCHNSVLINITNAHKTDIMYNTDRVLTEELVNDLIKNETKG